MVNPTWHNIQNSSHATSRATLIACAIFLLLSGVLMYFLNLYTPFFDDDWLYVFIWGTHTKVQSLGDIAVSQWHHYTEHNGRFIVHFIVQFFDGILGKRVFNIFNAIVFMLFIYGVTLVSSLNKRNQYKVMSTAFLLVFLLMAGFKHTFLWMSGSCNYFWVATACLFFHYLLFKESDKMPSWSFVPLGLFGFICGWSHEGLIVPLGAAYFFYFLLNRKEITPHRTYMLLGLYLGAALLVFSPGSIHRFQGNNSESIDFITRLFNMRNMRLFYVLILLVAYKSSFKKISLLKWIKEESIFIMALIIAFIFVLVSGAKLPHSRFGVELFSLLLILRLINWDKINPYLVNVMNVAVFLFAVYVITICHKCDQANQEEISQIQSSNCIVRTSQPVEHSFIHRYALHYMGFEGFLNEKQVGEYFRINDFYQFTNVQFIPKELVDSARSDFHTFDKIKSLGKLPFWAKRLPDNTEIHDVYLNYDESYIKSMPKTIKRIIRLIFGYPFTTPVATFQVNIDGYNYVVIPNPWPDHNNRLSSIKIELKKSSSIDSQ